MSPAEAPRLAYVVGRYPAISHAFLLREVATLRSLGATVETFSVRRVGPDQILTDEDREAYETTYSILPPRLGHLVGAHLRAVLTRPRLYARALSTALGMRRPSARGALWQLFYLAEAGVMWDRCRRLGLRHVHAQFASNSADVALLTAELGGPRWSWSVTLHGPTDFYNVKDFRLPEKARRAAFVVCTSDFARSQVQAFVDPAHWPKLQTVPMGVDAERFKPSPRPDGDAAGPLRIITVGRLAPVKGQAVMLDAIAELARRGVAAHLTIAGDGPERDQLERRTAKLGLGDRVEFTGPVGHSRLSDLYAAADVFCTSSFAEGLPTVLMEAMATGLPTVATRIMGVPELVEHGVTGLLVPPARADLLADALEQLASQPAERREMGEAGRRKVIEERDPRDSGRRLLDLVAKHAA